MNELKQKVKITPEDNAPKPEVENNYNHDSEPPLSKTLDNDPKKIESMIEEARHRLQTSILNKPLLEEVELKNPVEIEEIDGKEYYVEYVPKEEIYPAYGYGGGGVATVRQDLPPRVKRFVKAHELYHCQDKATWGGWIGGEIRANIVPGLKDPIGLMATIIKTVTDIDRLVFYLGRIIRKY